MGFIGLLFSGTMLLAAVAAVFAAAVVGIVRKIEAGEPFMGTAEDKKKISGHIVAVLAVIGAFFMLPYAVVFFAAAVIWVLWRLIRGKSLDKETMLKTAVLFLAAFGAVFSVLMAYGGLSALIIQNG